MRKRIISLFTALMIGCTAVIMPVFADASESSGYVYTFDGFTNNNTGVEINDKCNIPNGWSETNGRNESNKDTKKYDYNRVETYAKKGIYGKDANDTSYEINTTWYGGNLIPASTMFQSRYNVNQPVNGKKYVNVSYEMAVSKIWANRWFAVQFKDSNGAWGCTQRLFEIRRDDTKSGMEFYVNGEKSNYTIAAEKWLDFDIVFDMTEKTADLYVNGELLKSDVSVIFNTKTGVNSKFAPVTLDNMQFGVYQQDKYLATVTYLDNVSYLLTDTKPTVDKYTAPDVIDFQNYNGGELPQGYDYKEGKYQPFKADKTNTNQTYLKYEGLRGKNKADISWRINAPERTTISDEYQNYRWKTNMDVSTNNTGFVKFSTEFCMEGASMTRGIALKTTHTNGGADTDLIKIEYKNGKQVVTVGGGISQNNNTDKTNFSGQIKTIDLPMSVVMKIDAVINRTKCTFDLYINGKEVATDVSMGTSYIAQVEEVILYAQQKWVGNDVWEGVYGSRNCFPASETYFDTMELGRYYSYPTVEPYTSPSVTVMSKYNETLTLIDSGETGKTYGHWVPLRGYDSKYYYYAENVTMPNDNATRTYKATFGKATINNAKDTTIITNDNLIEVKNGKVKIYGQEITATVPTNERFKLSFLFDVLNKSYNVYVNDEAIAVDIKFDTNNSGKPITEFSSIENTVKAGDNSATVSIEPVASGAFTKLPEYAKVCDLTKGESKINAKMLSQYISGRMILAVYGKDGVLKNIQIGDGNTKTLEADAADTDTAKLMLWDLGDMTPVIRAVEIK